MTWGCRRPRPTTSRCGCPASPPTERSPRAATARAIRRVAPACATGPTTAVPGSRQARFLHTLNGSGLAVGRTVVAVLENYQEDRRLGDDSRSTPALHGDRSHPGELAAYRNRRGGASRRRWNASSKSLVPQGVRAPSAMIFRSVSPRGPVTLAEGRKGMRRLLPALLVLALFATAVQRWRRMHPARVRSSA